MGIFDRTGAAQRLPFTFIAASREHCCLVMDLRDIRLAGACTKVHEVAEHVQKEDELVAHISRVSKREKVSKGIASLSPGLANCKYSYPPG